MTESAYPEQRRLIELYDKCIERSDELEMEVVLGRTAFEVTVDGKTFDVPNLDELDSLLCGVGIGITLKKEGK